MSADERAEWWKHWEDRKYMSRQMNDLQHSQHIANCFGWNNGKVDLLAILDFLFIQEHRLFEQQFCQLIKICSFGVLDVLIAF